MGVDLRTLFDSDARYLAVAKAILETPFIEHQVLAEMVSVSSEDLTGLIATLVERMVVLELASQADSSIEARVPKTVYMINPEEEAGVREHV